MVLQKWIRFIFGFRECNKMTAIYMGIGEDFEVPPSMLVFSALYFKGYVAGSLLAFVCPRLHVDKILLSQAKSCVRYGISCSLGTFLKYVVLFILANIQRVPLFGKKMRFLSYFSHFWLTGEKTKKSLTTKFTKHRYMYFAHPFEFYCLTNFAL